jgi:hypothetical protein
MTPRQRHDIELLTVTKHGPNRFDVVIDSTTTIYTFDPSVDRVINKNDGDVLSCVHRAFTKPNTGDNRGRTQGYAGPHQKQQDTKQPCPASPPDGVLQQSHGPPWH